MQLTQAGLTLHICLTLKLEQIVQENLQITINEMAGELKISHGMAHHIIHSVLQYQKVSVK